MQEKSYLLYYTLSSINKLIEKYELYEYYKDILPQLGWQINESASQSILKFNRGKEMLRITVSKAENKIVVIFFSILLANQ